MHEYELPYINIIHIKSDYINNQIAEMEEIIGCNIERLDDDVIDMGNEPIYFVFDDLSNVKIEDICIRFVPAIYDGKYYSHLEKHHYEFTFKLSTPFVKDCKRWCKLLWVREN